MHDEKSDLKKQQNDLQNKRLFLGLPLNEFGSAFSTPPFFIIVAIAFRYKQLQYTFGLISE